MRVFFIGTVKFSYLALEVLLKNNYNIVGVATKNQSALNSDYQDLTPLCKSYNVAFKYVNDINHSNNIQYIRELSPDVIFCFGWSSLIKEELLNLCRLGVIGYHPAFLPFNKGRHPIIWALALGLKETGSTFFFMDEGADTGDILSQEGIQIESSDDAFSLYNKITHVAINQIVRFGKDLSSESYERNPQPVGVGNTWRKRGKSDGRIDFRMHTQTICNLVKALFHPYVGAHLETKSGDIKIWKVEASRSNLENVEPGKVLDVVEGFVKVKTADGAILLKEHEFLIMPKVGEYL